MGGAEWEGVRAYDGVVDDGGGQQGCGHVAMQCCSAAGMMLGGSLDWALLLMQCCGTAGKMLGGSLDWALLLMQCCGTAACARDGRCSGKLQGCDGGK